MRCKMDKYEIIILKKIKQLLDENNNYVDNTYEALGLLNDLIETKEKEDKEFEKQRIIDLIDKAAYRKAFTLEKFCGIKQMLND